IGTLKVDGKAVDTKTMPKTLPMILQWDAAFTDRTLGANGSLRTLCALRTGWTNRAGRAGLSRRTKWALRPRITRASQQCEDRDSDGHAQHASTCVLAPPTGR